MVLARCKFQVAEVTDQYGGADQTIRMHTIYDENDPEDTKFSSATPWGKFEFGLSNPHLIGKFEVGQVYYLDLTLVGQE